MTEQYSNPEFIDGSKGKSYDRTANIDDSFAGTRVLADTVSEVEATPGMDESAKILWDAAEKMNPSWKQES